MTPLDPNGSINICRLIYRAVLHKSTCDQVEGSKISGVVDAQQAGCLPGLNHSSSYQPSPHSAHNAGYELLYIKDFGGYFEELTVGIFNP